MAPSSPVQRSQPMLRPASMATRAFTLGGSTVSRVADKVGLERTHLYRKLKQLGIKFVKKGSEDKPQ